MNRFLFATCIAASIALQAQNATPIDASLRRIFESQEFKLKTFGPAAWLDGGSAYTTVENKEIVRYDTATGKREVLVPAAKLTPKGAKDPLTLAQYTWSEDRKRLLIFTNTKKVWRLNTRGDYWVLEVDSGKLAKLGGRNAPEASLMFAKFSPDGKQAAYVRDNNIYVEDLGSNQVRQLTTDGSPTRINGTSDWVYEEELHLRDAFRWSPDSRQIAYWQFDSTGVGVFHLIDNTSAVYPRLIPIPYPKVGTTNSAVRLGVIPASGGKTRWFNIPGDPREHYIARAEWDGQSVVLQQLNRLQNRNDVFRADPKSGDVKRIFHDEDKAWVDFNEPHPAGPGAFLWLSERDGWRRAYAVSNQGVTFRPVTPAGVDVMQIAAVTKEWLYYIAAPGIAVDRSLFRARLTGDSIAVEQLSKAPGTHSYNIAPSGEFAFHTHSTFDQAPVTDLVRLPSHERVRLLAENRVAIETPPVEFFQLDIGGGVTMDAWMIKPANFDPSKKYPVLTYVYGEPAGVTVTNAWQGSRELFHRAIANLGYLVVSMDNRGTPAPKGRDWRKVVYGAVGVLSAQEQAAGMRKLIATRPYVDGDRIAVWGWSGGGSNTLNVMFRSPDLYKVGMSVAPVPDQTLYDTIYQERYMGVPKDNPEGYRTGSPITYAEGLAGRLLIVHGTGDDNVHYQGLERLMNRLIELGKPFDMMAYPNRSHSINEGKGTSFHLHALLARYLLDHLPPGPR